MVRLITRRSLRHDKSTYACTVTVETSVQERSIAGRARPIGAIVDVAGPLVMSYLGELAERHSSNDAHIGIVVQELHRGNGVRRDILLNPAFQRAQEIERVRSWPTPAMVHSRFQEESRTSLQVLIAAEDTGRVLVEADGCERRYSTIAVALVEDELAASRQKRPQSAGFIAIQSFGAAVQETDS